MDIYIEISPDSLKAKAYQFQILKLSSCTVTSFNKDVKEQPWVRAVCI